MKEFVTTVIEAGAQLQWRMLLEEEAKTIQQQCRPASMEIPQDQLCGEGKYTDIQREYSYDNQP